jgi:hypothetical protein
MTSTNHNNKWWIAFFGFVWLTFSGACFLIVMVASLLHGAVPTYVFYEVFIYTAIISFGTTILYKKEKFTFQQKKKTLTSLQGDITVQEGCAKNG